MKNVKHRTGRDLFIKADILKRSDENNRRIKQTIVTRIPFREATNHLPLVTFL